MKTKSLIILSIVLSCAFIGCKNTQSTAHNSQNSLDWAGLYKGSCTSSTANNHNNNVILITLNSDLTYTEQCTCGNTNDITTFSGTFTWNKLGNEITLKNKKTKTTYQVLENQLKRIKVDGIRMSNEANGSYSLTKVSIEGITEKYWKLIELNGNPVVNDDTLNREPYIIFKADNRINGTGGCNIFNGSYELQESTNRIKMSQVMSSMMACANMEIEGELLRILQSVDNYTLSADGTTLSLNKARMAPLARFEVVYLK